MWDEACVNGSGDGDSGEGRGLKGEAGEHGGGTEGWLDCVKWVKMVQMRGRRKGKQRSERQMDV